MTATLTFQLPDEAQQHSDAIRGQQYYDNTAPSQMNRRRSETLVLPNLRDWMDTFCAKVIAAIEAP